MNTSYKQSLLSGLSSADVIMDPYPHVILKNVISKEMMDELLKTFPPIEVITKTKEYGSNKRYDYTINDIRKDQNISPIWKDFIEAQADKHFLDDFIRIFTPAIQKYYPGLITKYGSLDKMVIGTRYVDSHDKVDLLADAHISINTPVTEKPTSVRSAHVDDPKKLYGGLFYMRLPQDDSSGGNLEISRLKNKKAKFFGQGISSNDVEVVNTVSYENNTFVLFLNTIDSVHGVTPRSVTKYPRLFVNLVAELKDPLFDIQSRQENIWIKRIKTLRNKILKV